MNSCEKAEQLRQTGEGGAGGLKKISGIYRTRAPDDRGNQAGLHRPAVLLPALVGGQEEV